MLRTYRLCGLLFTLSIISNIAIAGHPGEENKKHPTALIPDHITTPNISLEIYTDELSGYNLVINTQHYLFTPPQFEKNPPWKMLEGHAHIFINGVKVQRAYGQYIHLSDAHFKEGINQISVSLNDHEHATWATADSKEIMATIIINTNQSPLIMNHFSTSAIAP